MATAAVAVPLSGDGLHLLGPPLVLSLILAAGLHALWLLAPLPAVPWKLAVWLACVASCRGGLDAAKAPVPLWSALLLEGAPLVTVSQHPDRKKRNPMPAADEPPQSQSLDRRTSLTAGPSLRRADPQALFPRRVFESPWSQEAKLRAEARKLTLQADFDVFRSDLDALRSAREAFGCAAAQAEAETAVFEMRCRQETRRYEMVSRDHFELAQRFMAQLELFESFRGRPGASPELIDALKERELAEFVACMNRISKLDASLPDPHSPRRDP